MTSLRTRSIRSVAFNGAGQYATQALGLLTAAVLGRLLDPEDFGLVGMILAANAFLMILATAGVSSTVVQFKKFENKDFQALLGLSCFVGLAAAAFLALLAPFLALFFREPRLELIAVVWAPALIFTALAQVPQGMLQRNFLFAQRSTAMVLSAMIAAGLAIWSAYNGLGYWALVLQSLLRTFLLFLFAAFFAKIRLLPSLDLKLYRKVFSYTGNLTLFQFINYFHRNLDNLLIGRFLGAAQLGFYTRAYSLLSIFNTAMSGVINPVLHAAMARKQDDMVSLRNAYGQVISIMLWVSAPMMGALAALSPEVIRLVWGPGWENAERPFFWLAIAGMHQAVYGTIGTVFAVRYKTKQLLVCGLVTTILYGLAIAFGVQHGIATVAKFYSLMSIALFLPLMLYVWRGLLEGRAKDLLAITLKPMAIGGIVLLAVGNIRVSLLDGWANADLCFSFDNSIAFFFLIVSIVLVARSLLGRIKLICG